VKGKLPERKALTPAASKAIHDRIRTVGIQAEFAKTAKRLLRETPEYAQAKKEGRATEWLEGEAQSFGYSAHELLLKRLEDLDA
jgi:hypothetical protein